MSLLRTISFLTRLNPSHFHKPLLRTLCTSLQLQTEPHLATETNDSDQNNETQMEKSNLKPPLDALFKQAVGLSPKPQDSDNESESESQESELKRRLKNLEREISELREKDEPKKGKTESKAKTLRALFTSQTKPMVFKDLSPDMEMFVAHLYSQGYFKDANFLPGNRLDFGCFGTEHSRRFVKFAAIEFGKDHPQIAQCLSGRDLKKVAMFGCPVLSKKDVYGAKRLRKSYEIEEATVCCKCMLKESCPFVDEIGYGDAKMLRMGDIMRVITLYALECSPEQLIVPDEIKASVTFLLNEIVKLSKSSS